MHLAFAAAFYLRIPSFPPVMGPGLISIPAMISNSSISLAEIKPVGIMKIMLWP